MASIQIHGGNDLANLAMRVAYASRRDAFRGAGTRGAFSFTFDVAQPPVVRLVADEPTHNVEIDLERLEIRVKGGLVGVSRTLALRATGTLALDGASLSLTGLHVVTTASGVVDRVVAGIIDSRVIPRIGEALAAVPLPRLTGLFGRDLSVVLRAGEVRPGPVLVVHADLAGAEDARPADGPSETDVAALNDSTDGSALVLATISGDVVNALMAEMVPPIEHALDVCGDSGTFRAGVRGTVRATTPILDVAGGRATARTSVTVDGLRGGVRFPWGGSLWLPVPSPTTEVVVEHALRASGRRGTLTLTGVESIEATYSWPRALRVVEAVANALLASALVRMRHRIEDAVSARSFELFSLPDRLPESAADVELAFEGLGYVASSVRAAVRVRHGGLASGGVAEGAQAEGEQGVDAVRSSRMEP